MSNKSSHIKSPFVIFLVVYLVLFLFIFHPRISGNDEIGYYVYLRSAMIDRDFDFTNEFAHYKDSYLIVGYSSVTGKPVNGLPIGSAILWLPFFLLAHFGIWVAHLFGSLMPMDGYSMPYIFAICFGSSLYAFFGLLLIYQLAKNIFANEKVIKVAILLFWLASPLVYYMYLQPAMAHANSVFAVSLFLYLWYTMRGRESFQKWCLLGVIGSIMTLVRFQDALFVVIPWVDYVLQRRKEIKLRSILQNALSFGLPFFIIFLPQLLVWKSIFGSYFSGPESHQIISGTNLLQPHLLAVLFSGRHGLITWHPIILFSLVGTVWLYQKDKWFTGLLVGLFIVQLYLISSWHEYWGAHSFGHRMFLSSAAFFVLGLIAFLEKINNKIPFTLIYLGSAVLIIWNLLLIAQYTLGLIDRDGTTPFLTVIYNQIFVVPTKFNEIIRLIFSS
ncbi:MAG: glycosyltransferase family 39 protein [bacterium]|nr:glycosyltransferase family 39 protein [bacterium]